VVDLTRVLAGPYCTQMLGDLGADVIKIERPGTGDDTRKFAPPYLKDAAGKDTSEAAYFMAANRNKRSVTVDIGSPAGQDLVRKLAAVSDVLVENFKTGNLARYGLGYDDLRKINRKLVYCSVTGFGQTGPYAERPGYDFLIQGMGGAMSITGDIEGAPQKVGVPVADLFAGMFAGVAVCAALRRAAVTGEGEYIDIGMLDTTVAWMSIAAMNYLYAGELGRLGNAHPNIVPYQPFKCADHYIIVVMGNDSQFARFCDAVGRADLPKDPRFATNQQRVMNRKVLVPILDAIFAAKPATHWLEELERLQIGCGPINNLAQVFADPHVLVRDMVVEMAHPAVGGRPAKLVGSPFKLVNAPVAYREPPPLLGQHTDAVLRDVLKLAPAEIEKLRKAGTLG
jgi:crotonobetainyl-CoA:carnitine CoA-transferase CaiB-like acyl-CoA transferase